jgi:hypothetical protein
MGGSSGIAVKRAGLGGQVTAAGGLRSGVAWSTMKTGVAAASIAAGTSQQALLTRAITVSDNAAAEQLWSSLGSPDQAGARVNEQLRAAGDERTRVQTQVVRQGFSAFGQTEWALTDQARFTAGLTCTAPGKRIVELMSQVVPGQRWGLGSAGVPAVFKGGWGPGDGGGYLVRQMGILTIDERPIAVSIATLPADGSFDSGTRNLTQIAHGQRPTSTPKRSRATSSADASGEGRQMRRSSALTVVVAFSFLGAVLAPSAGAATKISQWSPFAADGSLRAGLSAAPGYGGECFTGTFVVHNAFRCLQGNRLRDPCFADPSREDAVVCVPSPFARIVVRLRFNGSLPSDSSARLGALWALRLANGQRCTFLQGATTVDGAGRRANFACSGRRTVLWGNPNRTSKTWRIRLSHSYAPGPQPLVVVREAFIGRG